MKALHLPESLQPLIEISQNLLWSWDPEIRHVFRDMDPDLWTAVRHNPRALLQKIDTGRLDALSRHEKFLARVEAAKNKLAQYLSARTWFDEHYRDKHPDFLTAYFAAEYGIAEGLPIYSGGLGVLSAEHLKSASDLGIPMVAIGLLYHKTYRQYLDPNGWQKEEIHRQASDDIPITQVFDKAGNSVCVGILIGDKKVTVQIWKAQVGRVPLFLLDTDIKENDDEAKDIIDLLYLGGPEKRIQQEMILGICGTRALEVMGYQPTVYHLNEGHCAFLILENARLHMRQTGQSFEEACQAVAKRHVFTTHTPVLAGFDRFGRDHVTHYFKNYAEELGVSTDAIMDMGIGTLVSPEATDAEAEAAKAEDRFNMAILASHFSGVMNGVSRLHTQETKSMWRRSFTPDQLERIRPITNGIHLETWISPYTRELFDKYFGPDWKARHDDPALWEKTDAIPDEEIWELCSQNRNRLIQVVRRRFKRQKWLKGRSEEEVDAVDVLLSPDVLTIGFARRFAPYKRGGLIFSDVERIARLIKNAERPVQLIFAGKAHPSDERGKKIIQEIYQIIHKAGLSEHVIYLEEYDIGIARGLVQGVDVWLNTPRRPLEASGTSGMKVIANAGLHLSTLDGWWDEGFSPDVGWAIGTRDSFSDSGAHDQSDLNALYQTLENEVIPAFYDQDANGMSIRWVRMLRASMKKLAPFFSTQRMVKDYTRYCYLPE